MFVYLKFMNNRQGCRVSIVLIYNQIILSVHALEYIAYSFQYPGMGEQVE